MRLAWRGRMSGPPLVPVPLTVLASAPSPPIWRQALYVSPGVGEATVPMLDWRPFVGKPSVAAGLAIGCR